jgi:hypothetical protein
MTEEQWVQSLDRETPTPEIDVASSVLRDIRLRQVATTEPGLGWPALIATLAGGGAALAAFQVVAALSDPFSGLFDAFKLVLQ